ncbi:putative phosphatase KNAG_0M01740 [Huiozyma naganishii CBS 8797]|uniref:FCP1 homology domain-containing protein n=1 Tax=Huiozyma naganishii (strain ATCC MYA-139 / BCRC 22969 / CBS 8797 / KCTC 17520 / NBRC 10181 / NCYC 3082 / Yp74L-3) TaxID=1071383 RepID=J7S475_HUIN7|nr:hypothetical protein KNAG_0M01740 [Kazachstania naganishii CBS 8797]CCK73027.1 hypothetical protein KNAG_0M01740 [Kazachstania naganishii CBS 8797]
MGFISSILCCATNSSSTASKKNNKNNNYDKKRQPQSYASKNTVSSTAVVNTKETQAANGRASDSTGTGSNNRHKYKQKDTSTTNEQMPHSASRTNSSAVQHQKQSPEGVSRPKQVNGGSQSAKLNGGRAIGNSDGDADDEDYEEDYDMDDVKRDPIENNSQQSHRVDEKDTLNVYNNETDRSTGNSSSDYPANHQKQRQQKQADASTHDPMQVDTDDKETPKLMVQGAETQLTSVQSHEADNNPVIDPNVIYSDGAPNDQTTDAQDYNMTQPFDEVDEDEFVDLTVLQPDQYHAAGYSTLLPPPSKAVSHRKCLVLDLDETLVHSSFKYLKSADFVLPVDIDDQIHNVYVIKRPGVDEFLRRVGKLYEVVVFTASVSRYGDPLLDILDKDKSIHHRLFREACYNYEGNYIKNLSQIGRPLSNIIILDNSPASYIFHPQHAIPISSWFSDTHDNELLDIIPLLEDLAMDNVLDVGKVLDVSI